MQGVPLNFENSPSSNYSSPAEESEEGNAYSDDAMELTFKAQKEIDLILDKRNKRERGERKEDRECRTPTYPRAVGAARVVSGARAVGEGEERGVDNEPIDVLAVRQGIQHTPSIPLHIDAYHAPFPSMMPHRIQTGMMLNLHLNNAMPSLPSFPLMHGEDLGIRVM
jgi:hypothetical protein